MNQIQYIITSFKPLLWGGLAGLSLLLASCNSDNAPCNPENNRVAVQFGTQPTITTKIISGGNQWEKNDKIGVFMINHGADLAEGTIAEKADNRCYVAQKDYQPTTSFGPLDVNQTIYYPVNGSVDFVAYYPHSAIAVVDYCYPIDLIDQVNQSDLDVLYTKTDNKGIGYIKEITNVSLDFQHKLVKLIIQVTNDSEFDAFHSVNVEGVSGTAKLNLADGELIEIDANREIETKLAEPELFVARYEAILMPQDKVAGSKVIFNTRDGFKPEWDISNIEFKEGNRYTYNVTVKKTGIKIETEDITIWDKQADKEVSIGTTYKVGDYYPNPIDPNTAIGVVFWIKDGGKYGKIVSPEEMERRWADNNNSNIRTNVNHKTDGSENMYLMRKFINIERKSWSDFPAFEWVVNKNKIKNDEAVNITWYIPSVTDLELLYKVHDDSFNSNIGAIDGGTPLSGTYWASSEKDKQSASALNFHNGAKTVIPKNQTSITCRAIADF